MKLISCYIENYGLLKQKKFEFNNLNSFCEKNGYGKTTLASFLKAMFYGLETYRSNDKSFADRQHFYPFDGGLFGGNVVFEFDNDTYRIERFFSEKSDTKDTIKVYKNGSEFNGFEKYIGESIFGIDKDSFERTIFIDSGDLETASTQDIKNKLNNIIEGCDDDSSSEIALIKLEKKKSEYKKSKSENALIPKTKKKLQDTEEKIKELDFIKNQVEKDYHRVQELNQLIKDELEKLDVANKTQDLLNKWNELDQEILNYEVQKNNLEEKYQCKFPTKNNIESIKELFINKKTIISQNIDDKDEKRLSFLDTKLKNEAIDDFKLKDVLELIKQYNYKKGLLNKEKENAKYEYIYINFENNYIDEKIIDNITNNYEEYCTLNSEEAKDDTKLNIKKYILFAILPLLFILSGIIINCFNVLYIGWSLLIIGFIMLCGVLFIYSKKAIINKKKNLEIKKHRKNKEEEITKALNKYGYYQVKDFSMTINKLKEDYNHYCEFKNKQANLKTHEIELSQIDNQINSFFAKCGILNADYLEAYTQLNSELVEYRNLKEQIKRKLKQKEESLKIINDKISSFCQEFNIEEENVYNFVKDSETDLDNYNYYCKNLEERRKQLLLLKKNNNLSLKPEYENLEERRKILNVYTEELNNLKNTISKSENKLEAYDVLLKEKDDLSNQLNIYNEQYKLLEYTIQYLKNADDNLKRKFLSPIVNNFSYYINSFEKAFDDKMIINPNLELKFEQNGQERSYKHLSSGEKIGCLFCLRMALIENMYTKELPFLILDDPFVYLDQIHFEKIKEVLKDLSSKFQIIYFTCHESRKI